MKRFYQQVAAGISVLGQSHKFHSKKIFLSKEAALDEMDEFINKVTEPKDSYDMFYLKKDGLKTVVVELVCDSYET